jgi:hypothetical protein
VSVGGWVGVCVHVCVKCACICIGVCVCIYRTISTCVSCACMRLRIHACLCRAVFILYQARFPYLYFLASNTCILCPWMHTKYAIKLIAFELAGEDRDRRGNPVLRRLKIAFFRVAQTWSNGIFPLPREFCGQLKHNQLYLCLNFPYRCLNFPRLCYMRRLPALLAYLCPAYVATFRRRSIKAGERIPGFVCVCVCECVCAYKRLV